MAVWATGEHQFWRLDEVALDLGAREVDELGLRAELVHHVTKLVEEGLDLRGVKGGREQEA